jgi:hypothetical protein
MTLYEWKITDLGNSRYGYLWIQAHVHDDMCKQFRCRDSEHLPRVIIDVFDLHGNFEHWSRVDGGNRLANFQILEGWNNWYGRVLAYWRGIGCRVIDRKALGYDAPWFPWAEAGFTEEEQNECIRDMTPICG